MAKTKSSDDILFYSKRDIESHCYFIVSYSNSIVSCIETSQISFIGGGCCYCVVACTACSKLITAESS
jgi:hypothetical protein